MYDENIPPDAELDIVQQEIAELDRKAMRIVLPHRRYQETFSIPFHNNQLTVSVGYSGHKMMEVFITTTKVGTDIEALARDGAILISLALQHGVDISTLANAITRKSGGDAHSIIGLVIDKLSKENQT